jgi:hypothetical protein
MQFATDAYVVHLALEMLGVSDMQTVPDKFPATLEGQQQLKWQLAEEIVSKVWLPYPAKEQATACAVKDGGILLEELMEEGDDGCPCGIG